MAGINVSLIKSDFKDLLSNFNTKMDNAQEKISKVSEKLDVKIENLDEKLTETVSSVTGKLNSEWNEFKEDPSKYMEETGAKLTDTFTSVAETLSEKGTQFSEWCNAKATQAYTTATESIKNNLEEFKENPEEWLKKTGATVVTTCTSILTGVGDLVEKLGDGLTWLGGKLVEGGSFIVAKGFEYTYNEDKAKAVMEWREQMKIDLAAAIATDVVQNINSAFYENTKLGQTINEYSALKYDSKTAQVISGITEKVAEFAAATAITIATGGAAAPASFAAVFSTGFVAGVGGKAEEEYQKVIANGGTPNLDDSTGKILATGFGSGLSWYGQGQAGKGILEAGKAIKQYGVKETVNAFKQMFTGASKEDRIKSIFSKGNFKKLGAIDNLADSGSVIADDVIAYMDGDKEVSWKSILSTAAKFIGTMSLNFVTGGLTNAGSVNQIDNVVEGTDDILKNADGVMDSVDDVSKSADDIKKLQQEYDELVAYTNSEKGGFDAVYGRGADKARYNDSVARIREIEDVLKNTDNLSAPAKNVDDVIDSADDVSKSTADIKKLQQEYDELVAYTNSEKGGFDAVYGRGADKARYDDSMARIREIEDILKNTDDVSSSVKNADDVVEILDDVTEPVKDVDIGVKNINSQDKNIKIAEQILDQNSEQTLLEVSKHLDDNDIKEVLACLSPEEIARELETANKFEYVDIMKKLSYDDKINVIYEQAKLAANGEYNAFFINFREHAALHTNNVRDYAVDFAKSLENVNLDEIYYGAQFHDFGMKNSGLYWNGEKYLSIGDVTKDDLSFKELTKYIGDSNGVLKDDLPKFILDNYGIDINAEGVAVNLFPDDIIDEAFSNKIADLARGNHPVNSAVTVLTTGITPEGVDEATVALLAMSHSKSTSGIQDFSNVEQWKKCIAKLGAALEADGTMSAQEIAAITKKLDELVGDGSSPEFKRLVNEAIAIRDGDAMSALALTSNGDTIMQTGNYSHVEYTGKAKLSADYSEVPSSKNEEIDGIVDIIHDAEDPSKTTEVKNRFSKKTHAGELNVRFDSDYDGDVYYSISKVSDPTSAPYSTLDSIFERAGEVATYGNCSDRIFEIELPKAMEDTALGNWYKKTVVDMASDAITTATNKGNFSIQLDNFYKNCIKVVFR